MQVGTAYLLSTFDLVNVGDVIAVRQAAAESDRVEARVLSDDAVREVTGVSPVVPARERLEIVGSLREIADAAIFDPRDALKRGPRDVVFARADVGVGRAAVDRLLMPREQFLDDWVRTAPTTTGGVLGYVPGAWDRFHIGHLNILKRARQMCDRLVVGVVTDEELFAAKGRMPMVPLEERVRVVAAMDIVDAVVVDFDEQARRVGPGAVRRPVQGRRLEGHGEGGSAGTGDVERRRVRPVLPLHGPHPSTALRQILAGRAAAAAKASMTTDQPVIDASARRGREDRRPTVRILGTHGVPANYGGFETAAEKVGLHLLARGWRVVIYCQVEGRGPITYDEW